MASVGPLLVWGVVEVGQDVPGSTFECPAQCDDLCEGAWHVRVAETVYFGLHQGLTRTRVGCPVGVDNVLVVKSCGVV